MEIKLPHIIIGLLVFTALFMAGCDQQEFTMTGDVSAHHGANIL